jgi:hypothetical protein
MTDLATVTPINSASSVMIERAAFYAALKTVAMFQSTDELRERLSAVYFETINGQLHIVATDGHTLAWAQPIGKVAGPDASILLHSGHVKALLAALKPTRVNGCNELTVAIGGSLKITGPDIALERSMSSTLKASDFPPYQTVVPEQTSPDHHNAVNVYGISPLWLERAGKAAIAWMGRGALRALSNDTGFTVTAPDEALSAMRLDMSTPDVGKLTLVLMPMRLG